MDKKEIQHLYWRAGFGIGFEDLNKIKKKSRKTILKKLFSASEKSKDLAVDLSEYEKSLTDSFKKVKNKTTDQRRKEQKYLREKGIELNQAWIQKMATSEALLREKMTLFWANVFVCADNNTWSIQNYNNTLRKHALGNFGQFVKAISHEASMIRYLNNKQNKKGKPNENFARELMELFTLGAGNYTENDIKESARAFTGWNSKRNGEFIFSRKQHDFGNKTFFGKTGKFDGNDIIDIILEQKQCAKFICTKVYKYFVNPVIDEENLAEITDLFYKDYDIKKLMFHIFNSDWFYDENNIGVKIKSPIELLVGIHKVVPFKFKNYKQQVYLQKMMGQILLKPVNVAGWKGGKSWIDSNTLMFRLKLPSMLLNNAQISLIEKGDIEGTFEEFYQKRKGKGYLKVTVDWDHFEKNYSKSEEKDLKSTLLISKIDVDTDAMLANLQIDKLKDYCIQLMSIPEYQLC
ncbi:DUF1800 domain-containing protein [Flavicella sediminum]|uniref:DUF1800 domain-containing protein n=1 Tax=Flavicella sediminum TaxID=2585141 RepID=UPI00111CB9EA|nr:DUF1800 domain-containing protein [Flavicella sediminum]